MWCPIHTDKLLIMSGEKRAIFCDKHCTTLSKSGKVSLQSIITIEFMGAKLTVTMWYLYSEISSCCHTIERINMYQSVLCFVFLYHKLCSEN